MQGKGHSIYKVFFQISLVYKYLYVQCIFYSIYRRLTHKRLEYIYRRKFHIFLVSDNSIIRIIKYMHFINRIKIPVPLYIMSHTMKNTSFRITVAIYVKVNNFMV